MKCFVLEILEFLGFLTPYILYIMLGRNDAILIGTLVGFYVGHRVFKLNHQWTEHKRRCDN